MTARTDQEYVENIAISDITEHPDNPRRGDDEAVAESVEANGFFGAILVHKQTGHVLAGNTRLRVLREAGEETVPGFMIDCDETTARRILLADNRVSDLAYYDESQVLTLLNEINADQGTLIGTGYDEMALTLLEAALSETETGQPDAPESFPIINPDDMEVAYRCPSCAYEWSGSPRPGDPAHEPSAE